MTKLTRRLVFIIVIILVAAVSSFATSVYLTLVRPNAPVPLTDGLHGKWADVSAEVDRRVKTSFPVGSREADMGAELHRQGFARQDWASSPDHEHEAMRREDGLPCRMAAYVYWRSDGGGRITAVRGLYREEGCL